jgi:hypothetical protein
MTTLILSTFLIQRNIVSGDTRCRQHPGAGEGSTKAWQGRCQRCDELCAHTHAVLDITNFLACS